MLRNVIGLLGSFAVAAVVGGAPAKLPAGLTQETYKTPYGERLLYQRHLPTGLTDGERVPLVLFLHGAGERGGDNVKQSVHVVPQVLGFLESAKQRAILLAPQCPNEMRWVNTDWRQKSHRMAEYPSYPLRLALDLVAKTMKEQPVDSSRVYVVGLSMGGYGTWEAICRMPDLFAAAVPICGGGDVKLASSLVRLPIWAWHGDKDSVVPVFRSQSMIEAIRAAGGKPKYTELPGVGHNAWTPAAAEIELWQWLFAQRRP